jgi:hypothetical protein
LVAVEPSSVWSSVAPRRCAAVRGVASWLPHPIHTVHRRAVCSSAQLVAAEVYSRPACRRQCATEPSSPPTLAPVTHRARWEVHVAQHPRSHPRKRSSSLFSPPFFCWSRGTITQCRASSLDERAAHQVVPMPTTASHGVHVVFRGPWGDGAR